MYSTRLWLWHYSLIKLIYCTSILIYCDCRMVILWCSVDVEKGPCLQVSTWVGGSIQWFLVGNMEVLRPYAIRLSGLVWSTWEFQYFCRFPVSNWFLGMMILFSFQLQAECSLLRADFRASVPIVLNFFPGFIGNWVFTVPHRHCSVSEVFASCVRPSEWSKAMTPKQRLGTRYCWGIATLCFIRWAKVLSACSPT